jgi:hypothetical protein
MLLNASQWQLTIVGFAGSLFQLIALYGVSKYRNQPFPAAAFVALYLPVTIVSWMLYYKVFDG